MGLSDSQQAWKIRVGYADERPMEPETLDDVEVMTPREVKEKWGTNPTSRMTGLSPASISNWAAGRRHFSKRLLQQVADALQIAIRQPCGTCHHENVIYPSQFS